MTRCNDCLRGFFPKLSFSTFYKSKSEVCAVVQVCGLYAAVCAVTHSPRSHTPSLAPLAAFTFWIAMLQLAMFIISFVVPHGKGMNAPKVTIGTPPLCGLFTLGAKWAPAVRFHFEVHRLVLPILLHGGAFHFIFNILFQCQLGFWLEDNMGAWRFICVYFACGLGGNLLSMVASPYSLSVGASGALFGLLGECGAGV